MHVYKCRTHFSGKELGSKREEQAEFDVEKREAETEKNMKTQVFSGANVQDTERRAEQQVYIKNALRSLAARDLETCMNEERG